MSQGLKLLRLGTYKLGSSRVDRRVSYTGPQLEICPEIETRGEFVTNGDMQSACK